MVRERWVVRDITGEGAMRELRGADWVNLSLIEDVSTQSYLFEIHLVIDLKDKDTMDDIRTELETAGGGKSGDIDGKEVKKKLKKLANAEDPPTPGSEADDHKSRRKIIEAIMVKPR
jgi:hypothetical protein